MKLIINKSKEINKLTLIPLLDEYLPIKYNCKIKIIINKIVLINPVKQIKYQKKKKIRWKKKFKKISHMIKK